MFLDIYIIILRGESTEALDWNICSFSTWWRSFIKKKHVKITSAKFFHFSFRCRNGNHYHSLASGFVCFSINNPSPDMQDRYRLGCSYLVVCTCELIWVLTSYLPALDISPPQTQVINVVCDRSERASVVYLFSSESEFMIKWYYHSLKVTKEVCLHYVQKRWGKVWYIWDIDG